MTNEHDFSMRSEEVTADEVVQAAKEFTVELLKGLKYETVNREFEGIIGQFCEHNTKTNDAFIAMLSIIVSRVTDPQQSPSIKDVLVRAASIHLIFAHMMSQSPRMKEVRQTMISVDPLSPATEDGVEGFPELAVTPYLSSGDETVPIIDEDFSLKMAGEISPEVVKQVVSRHMAAMKEELAAMSEAVKAKKH